MASLPATARDAGLVRGIGAVGLSGAFIGMLLGSGIYNFPAPMAAAVGSFAPLAYLGCALAVAAVMLCFAEATSRVPTAGGVSGFVDAAFGPYWGFLTGVFIWVSVVLAAGSIMAAATDIIGTVVPALTAGPWRALFILAWLLGLAALNTRGVGIGARLNVIATGIKIIPLAVFIAAGI